MGDYVHFSKDPGLWEESAQVLWGSHDICPSLTWFKVGEIIWLEELALSHTGAWGSIEKPQVNMAFLLIAPGKTIEGEMEFGLGVVWAHPHQAWLSSLDEVVKKLTLLIDLGENWAYAFVQLTEDAQHVPLSNEGHLSTMVNGAPCRSMCRHLYQLEVHKLLQYGDQVVYPEGLNGGLELVQTLLSGPLLWGMEVFGDSASETSFLLVDLSWVTLGDCMPEASAPHRTSTMYSPFHLAREHPPKTDSHISMTAEVQELLSCAMLDTSSQALGDLTPQRATSVALGVSPSTRTEASSKLVAPSPQTSPLAALPVDTVPISHSPSLTCVRNSWGGQHPYHTTIQDIHWGWHWHPPCWGTPFVRGDEHSHGAAAYNRGIHGHLLQEANFRYWGCLLWEWGLKPLKPFGKQSPIAWQPFGWLWQCMQQLSERQRPTAWLWFEMPRVNALPLSWRPRLPVPIMPASYNKFTGTVWRA